ncbi:MAG: extracellular solute-binding protein [Cyanobacteria bacterium P01_A01_bin.105]
MVRWPRRLPQLLTLMLVVQLGCLVLWGVTWPRPPVTLSFVVPEEEVLIWQQVVKGFEQQHPNLRILPVSKPAETYTTDQRQAIYSADLQTARLQNTSTQHDLVYMDTVWTRQFADELADLSGFVAKSGLELSDFVESELAVGRDGDALYRLPMRADVGVLYYRKDLLAALGYDQLPANWVALQPALTQKNLQGYLWQGSTYEGLVVNFVEALAALGGTWIDRETGQVGLGEPAAIQAATLLRQLIDQGVSPEQVTNYTEDSSLAAFLVGNAMFLRGWPYFWQIIQTEAPFADQVAMAPPFASVSPPGAGCRGGWGFGIPKRSAHPQAAWEAIQYLTSEPVQRAFVRASGFLPSRRSLFTDTEIVAVHPYMPDFLNYLDHASVFRPALVQYEQASQILSTALGEVLRGESATLAMERAAQETDRLLSGAV